MYMKNQALLVGDHLNTELWAEQLAQKGFECHQVDTVMEAIDKANEVEPQLVISDENLAFCHPQPNMPDVPDEFNITQVDQSERGQALVKYLRDYGMLDSDRPAYLVSTRDGIEEEKAPAGVTKVISLEDSLERLVQNVIPKNYHVPHQHRIKKILMVGSEALTNSWAHGLKAQGFECTQVSTAAAAVSHLQNQPDTNTQLLVDEKPEMGHSLPTKLQGGDHHTLGARLIAYARKNNLLADETPAYLYSSDVHSHRDVAPEGVTKMVYPRESVFAQIKPAQVHQKSETVVMNTHR